MSAKETCRWAILSTAEIAAKVCPALQAAEHSEVVAVASRSAERARAWADKHGVPHAGTYDEILAREDIDAVYVPLPSGLRIDWIRRAASAGKHVYAEKPFAPPYEDVADAVALCAQQGLQFMDGTMWLHSHRTREIHDRIQRGDIGKVRRVTAAFTFKAPDDDFLHGGNGRTDKTREPMGCFGDQGWYPITAILWAFDYCMPTKVMMTYVNLNRVDTIVSCGGTLWFSDGRMATFDCGAELPHRSQVEICGETGVIKIDDLVGGQGRSGNFDAYFVPFTGSDRFVQGDTAGRDEVVQVPPCDHVIRLAEDFVAAVRAGTPDPSWPRRTLAAHRVMCALFESACNGGAPVTITDEESST